MTHTVFNGGVIRVNKLSLHKLDCKRWLSCERAKKCMMVSLVPFCYVCYSFLLHSNNNHYNNSHRDCYKYVAISFLYLFSSHNLRFLCSYLFIKTAVRTHDHDLKKYVSNAIHCLIMFNLFCYGVEVGSREDGCSRDPTHSENCATQSQSLIRDITTNLIESPSKCCFI